MTPTYEHCIRCTICVENCPVFKVNPEYPGPKQAGPDAMRFRIDGEEKVDKWISLCTQCRRCEQVCPYDVKPASLILESQIEYVKKNGAVPTQVMFSNFHFISHLASFFAPIANFATSLTIVKKMMKVFGLRDDIPFPKFSYLTMQRKKVPPREGIRKAVFFHGCYLNGNAPDTGRDIISLIQSLGIEVFVPPQVCCGLPALGNGNEKKAKSFAERNAKIFTEKVEQGYDILYSCTSCGHTLIHSYPELLGEKGKLIADNSWNIYEYMEMLLEKGQINPEHSVVKKRVAYHIPCHLKGTGKPYPVLNIFRSIPGIELFISDENCCGFSGSYGFKKKNRETTDKLGRIAVNALLEFKPDVIISDCGACRMQIENFTDIRVCDPADIMKESLT
ncbi:MAG: anaerobic glycerol-3-phosphate dehydrogenase subunit C [Spirochaetaceae bacterium]|jgi:glycerol-3-phosphate dehydrogenase subunit C|nr:anaerobic glycerol-3-phosphate dehydrogenase subunit C [Spirochaetaceae bacterium]